MRGFEMTPKSCGESSGSVERFETTDSNLITQPSGQQHLEPEGTLGDIKPIDNVDEWVERTLASAGLPKLGTVKADAMRAIELLSDDLLDGPLSAVRDKHRDSGVAVFAEQVPILRFETMFRKLAEQTMSVPPIVLGEDFSIAADGHVRDWGASPISKHIDAVLKTHSERVRGVC